MNPESMNPNSPAVDMSSITSRYKQAHMRLAVERDALPESEWMQVRLDIPQMVSTVVGALPAIAALRPEIVKQLPEFDLPRFDQLESYALALGHAHTLYQAAIAPPESIQELRQEATLLRASLLSDVSSLVGRGLINGERLKDLKGLPGALNLAFDLFLICTIVRDSLAAITNKTSLTVQELAAAETLADRLVSENGERQQGGVVTATQRVNRIRAYTQLLQVYDHARRAVSHLRWEHADLDTIAPSLYAGRSSKRGGNDDAEPTPAAAVVVPAPLIGHTPALEAATSATPTTVSVPVGLPGGNPFSK